ncbi:MAG TPA: ABC transporter permease [Candidatus Limnocylindrales bacterium]|nr:ABC transporter permease [Candidatus Limnocylindrales bacterium]
MWRDVLVLALREVRRNALRSFLTVLGIVIGVAAVITMVTVGGGATAKIRADIASLGSNILYVIPGQHRRPGRGSGASKPFEIADVDAVTDQVSSLRVVVPTASQDATIVYGNASRSTGVTGTTDAFLDARQWPLASGRAFNDAELRGGKAVCLLGATVRRELFGGQEPVGETIRVGKISCRVIGLLAPKGQSSMGSDQDDTLLMPLRTVQRRLTGKQDINAIMVSVSSEASTEKAKRDITLLMRERRHISAGEEDDFTVLDMKEISAALTGTTQIMTMLLGAVAAVSMLVGGIGIMNIMLVSVTERTREIGTRLAIGALEGEVLTQFLVEAVVLASLGGLVGVGVAMVATVAICRAMDVPFILNPGIIAVAFLFSSTIGVVFGFFPARRAARLDPIEALRHE